jgi:hypothetical protein
VPVLPAIYFVFDTPVDVFSSMLDIKSAIKTRDCGPVQVLTSLYPHPQVVYNHVWLLSPVRRPAAAL